MNCSILDQYVQKEKEEIERNFNGSLNSDPSNDALVTLKSSARYGMRSDGSMKEII